MCELKGRIPCERHNLMSGVMKVAGSIKPLGQSGPIADLWPWTLWGLAIVYARKHRPVSMPEQIFLTLVDSGALPYKRTHDQVDCLGQISGRRRPRCNVH